ncbi:cytochrome P450 [Ktedonospora formicarum]|uniref:Putative cytochrome P450 YjiB n=1 Tax=Ktedonospora formicarum TaxID=2778364 RepID=A0A8J3I9J1_9CHLR|nr:cytochrome P450 [Ktedonospora formicarum]GHO51141.1 putative cytochrome P450 YjiB [Ktedonospora formicarum]
MNTVNLWDLAREYPASRMGLNPFSWYREMRVQSPVHFNKRWHVWEVFTHEFCQEILRRPDIFSSQRGAIEKVERERIGSILGLDPPRHHQLRALVSQAFTPRSIARLEGRIRQVVDMLLDRRPHTNQLDLIHDLAYPLPVIVLTEMLGVPLEELDTFKRYSDDMISDSKERASAGSEELDHYCRGIIQTRRQEPRDDLISDLLAARVDDKPLTEDEIVDFCILLLLAGNETTTNLIGNAMLCFDEQPEIWAELRANQGLLPGALEEVLRFRSPVQRMSRLCLSDTQIAGQHIRAGQGIFLWLGSANRDEQQFPHAETFDIYRSPNKHLAFGNGIHMCLASSIPRLEARIAYECLLTRFSILERDRSVPLQSILSVLGHGVKHLLLKIAE